MRLTKRKKKYKRKRGRDSLSLRKQINRDSMSWNINDKSWTDKRRERPKRKKRTENTETRR